MDPWNAAAAGQRTGTGVPPLGPPALIAVLGTGMVGRTLAARLSGVGTTSPSAPATPPRQWLAPNPTGWGPPFSAWASEHTGVRLAPLAEAAADADLIVDATNGFGALPALEQVGADHLARKVLIDISNPLDFSPGVPSHPLRQGQRLPR